LQQPENTITTRTSVETQEIVETLSTTTSHRSRPRGEVGGGGRRRRGGGLRSRSTGVEEEDSDLDPQEEGGEREASDPNCLHLPRRSHAVIHRGCRARQRERV